MSSYNTKILQYLNKLKEIKQSEGDRWRAIAYSKAISAIENYNEEITSEEQASNIKGIGKKIAQKIGEILDTGQLSVIDNRAKTDLEKDRIIKELLNIWGMGPSNAQKWYNKGITSWKELKRDVNFKQLTKAQRLGVKFYKDLQIRVPRSRLDNLVQQLHNIIKSKFRTKLRIQICGSYRRMCDTCGDIDVLISPLATTDLDTKARLFEDFIHNCKESDILNYDLTTKGKFSYMGITVLNKNGENKKNKKNKELGFRIDIKIIEREAWPFATLYFTGPGNFNKRQRLHALKLGLSLSEHGLKEIKSGKMIGGLNTESDIFDKLNEEYLEPCDRR